MASPTPTEAQVIAAAATEIDAVNPATGTVLQSRPNLDSEIDWIERYKLADHTLDLWAIYCAAIQEIAGQAVGEDYSIFRIVCEYWEIRIGDADWDKNARALVETVRDRLSKNANVFRIGGQLQLQTPEDVSVEFQGFEKIPGADGIEDQQVFKARLSFMAEARRWS